MHTHIDVWHGCAAPAPSHQDAEDAVGTHACRFDEEGAYWEAAPYASDAINVMLTVVKGVQPVETVLARSSTSHLVHCPTTPHMGKLHDDISLHDISLDAACRR